MLNKDLPFMDSVTLTIPYLQARSVGGALMTLGHLVFAVHFFSSNSSESAPRARPPGRQG